MGGNVCTYIHSTYVCIIYKYMYISKCLSIYIYIYIDRAYITEHIYVCVCDIYI